jgi:protein SCO1
MKRVSVIALLAIACAQKPNSLPYYNDARLTPEWQIARHRIADFALADQDGATVRSTDLDGKIYVASFFFTSCRQVCPRLKSSLARVQQTYRTDDRVELLSHSVMPEADSTAVLARYARSNGMISGKWHLLTGDRVLLRDLAARSYFIELDDDTGNTEGNLIHTEVLVLVDADRHIRGVYNGTLAFEVDQLIADIGLLLERD